MNSEKRSRTEVENTLVRAIRNSYVKINFFILLSIKRICKYETIYIIYKFYIIYIYIYIYIYKVNISSEKNTFKFLFFYQK